MNTVSPAPQAARQIVVVVTDAAAAAAPLAWSSVLARSLQRELTVVYVESTGALTAAALPITRALAHAGARWVPFGPGDVERGYRLQGSRLRALVQQVAQRQAVACSMQVVRAALHDAVLQLGDEPDLVLVVGAAPLAPAAAARCRSVAAWDDSRDDGDPLLQRLLGACTESLGVPRLDVHAGTPAEPPGLDRARADLLVLPRRWLSARLLALARRPLLLVGRRAK